MSKDLDLSNACWPILCNFTKISPIFWQTHSHCCFLAHFWFQYRFFEFHSYVRFSSLSQRHWMCVELKIFYELDRKKEMGFLSLFNYIFHRYSTHFFVGQNWTKKEYVLNRLNSLQKFRIWCISNAFLENMISKSNWIIVCDIIISLQIYSSGGKSSPSYSSPGPTTGSSSFYGDNLMSHESTPIPPHLAGLSFEQQAYLHNLSNPFHPDQRRNRYV